MPIGLLNDLNSEPFPSCYASNESLDASKSIIQTMHCQANGRLCELWFIFIQSETHSDQFCCAHNGAEASILIKISNARGITWNQTSEIVAQIVCFIHYNYIALHARANFNLLYLQYLENACNMHIEYDMDGSKTLINLNCNSGKVRMREFII